eukprot:jgi/Undpi1/9103/HiC_scaffold_26.g11561.m1
MSAFRSNNKRFRGGGGGACALEDWKAQKLKTAKRGLSTVGVGDLVRDEVKQGTAVGKQLKAFSDSGQLAPDEAINRLVKRRLEQPDTSCGFILDGFPRNLAQAKWLEESGVGVDKVVNITLPEWVTVVKSAARRSCSVCRKGFNVADVNKDGYDMPKILPDFDSCGGGSRCPGSVEKLDTRKDDTADIIRQRLAVYRKETAPLIEFYKAKGLLENFPVRRGIRDKDALVDVMVPS